MLYRLNVSRRKFLSRATLGLYAIGKSTAATASPADRLSSFGFTLDFTQASAAGDARAQLLANLNRQLQAIHQLPLSETFGRFIVSQPIVVDRELDVPGAYRRGVGVRVPAGFPAEAGPVILHELVHAFHDQKLAGGWKNPTPIAFHHDAVARRLYPARAVAMRNAIEYLAYCATAVMVGTIERAPFTRAAVRQNQPDFEIWIAATFMEGEGA